MVILSVAGGFQVKFWLLFKFWVIDAHTCYQVWEVTYQLIGHIAHSKRLYSFIAVFSVIHTGVLVSSWIVTENPRIVIIVVSCSEMLWQSRAVSAVLLVWTLTGCCCQILAAPAPWQNVAVRATGSKICSSQCFHCSSSSVTRVRTSNRRQNTLFTLPTPKSKG